MSYFKQNLKQALYEQSLQGLSNPNALPNIGGEPPVGDTEGGSDPGWPPMDPSTASNNWAYTYFDNPDFAGWWQANIPNWQWIQFMWDLNSDSCGASCLANWQWWLEDQLDADPRWQRWPIDGLMNLYAMRLPDGTWLIFWPQWFIYFTGNLNDYVGKSQCECDSISGCETCGLTFPNGTMSPY